MHLQIFQSFLCAVFLQYDYIEVIEFEQAKLILCSLQITHTPKLRLCRIESFVTYNWQLLQ